MNRSLIKEYAYLHSARIYGTSDRHYHYILPHILALRPTSLVDYGAGQSKISLRLGRAVGIKRIARFDPAVPEVAEKPRGAFDLLISLDVLEHIPATEMDTVLAEMASMAKHALHVIDVRPAKTILSDGRNAHVSLHSQAEWQELLVRHWPSVRPLKQRIRGRVAFKTWDAELPFWRHTLIERREALLHWMNRKAGRRWRSTRRRRSAKPDVRSSTMH